MYRRVNEDGDIEIDDLGAIRQARQIRLDGESVHGEILPILFSELDDLALLELTSDLENAAGEVDGIIIPLAEKWRARLPDAQGAQSFRVVLENLLLILDSSVAAASEALGRRPGLHPGDR